MTTSQHIEKNWEDIRGEIVRLTSQMLDNPREGIYPTTKFYDLMENYIRQSKQLSFQAGKDAAVDYIEREGDKYNDPYALVMMLGDIIRAARSQENKEV